MKNAKLRISTKIALKEPAKLSILRLSAYPIVKLRPSLRQLIVVVAIKARESTVQLLERWG
jgi:hypothetical protein